MQFKRQLTDSILKSINSNPVTAILGPRQSGKSTLAKQLLKKRKNTIYLDLERPSDIQKLHDAEWFLTQQKGKLICLDEIQRLPEIFPLIRSLVDEWGKNGHFLILGSASQELIKQSSETLAGRISFKYLTPFLWEEIKKVYPIELLLERGGFPRSLLAANSNVSFEWRQDFISSFLERDLLQWKYILPQKMKKLWQMLAHLNGQLLNYSMIGKSLGISNVSVKNYAFLLEQTFMISLVSPYHSNIKKRIIKAPKIYLTDTGINCTLLGIYSFEDLTGHPAFGGIWESFVLANLKGNLPNFLNYYFYRTSNGSEIDFVIEYGNKRVAVECKASVSPSLTKGNLISINDIKPDYTFIASPVKEGWPVKKGIDVVSLSELTERVKKILF
jgi:predicted AAA+ superfamily ATPase